MDSIIVKDIRCYAHHGCLEEESIIGSEYIIDLEVFGDFNKASVSDDLNDALDYVVLHRIVVEEMQTPSKLLEHVGKRILSRVVRMKLVIKAIVAIHKINPPIGGDVKSVCVKMEMSKYISARS